MRNNDIREAARKAGVKLWQIADYIGLNDGNFSRKLRHELSDEKKREIYAIINDLGGKVNDRQTDIDR